MTVQDMDTKDKVRFEINQCYGAITSIQEQLNSIVGEAQDARFNIEIALGNLSVVLDGIAKIKKDLEEIKNEYKKQYCEK